VNTAEGVILKHIAVIKNFKSVGTIKHMYMLLILPSKGEKFIRF
jgi:hypothetical protein